MKFQSLYDETIDNFILDYGQKKYNKIEELLRNSSRFKNTICNFLAASIAPSANGIVTFVRSIGYFTFSHRRYVTIAGLIFFSTWNKICNVNYKILSEEELIGLMKELLDQYD